MTDKITAPPPAPSRQQPDTFSDRADAFAAWMATFGDEINALTAADLFRDGDGNVSLTTGDGTQRALLSSSAFQIDVPSLTVDGTEVYRRGNLLGTVSQSGGDPTGAVIERGSNANGEYVRFADGTQICTKTVVHDGLAINIASGSLYRHDGVISHGSTMPAAFASLDAAGVEFMGSDNATIRNNLAVCRFGYFQQGETFTPWGGLQIFTTSSTGGTAGEKTTTKAWAIGRWF